MSEESLPRRPASPSDAGADETVRMEKVPRLTPGQQVLGRYILESVLGHGGNAVVWRAWDQTLGETVALKFLPTVLARDVVAVEELKEETRRARRLTHPNIVRIHDFVQDATMAAVSMEYVDGDTLAKLRLEQPEKIFSLATLAPLVTQLCAALDYAHGTAKMVHRDIKPANLLVTHDGQLKVADFGIARGMTEASTRLLAKAGGTSGTLVYGSPQQLMGEKPTPADDIYAVGSSLYELLTGKPPFFRGDASSLIMQVRDRLPAPMAQRRAELEMTGEPIPPEWEKTILACLAKRTEERPKSAREVAARLGLAGAGGGRREARGQRVESGAASPAYRWIVAAAALVMLGLAGYFFWPKAGRVILDAPPATAAFSREFIVTVDPVSAAARLSLGPFSNVEVKEGRAVLKDLPDGEHELTVQAPGFQPFVTRAIVKDGRGRVEARLIAAKGIFEVTARPGTRITAVNAQGHEARLGAVAADGVLASGSLLTVGNYTLKLEHPDCEPTEPVKMELEADRVTKLAPAQTPLPGELRVFSVPTGAEVRVNGQAAGRTPATVKNQPSEQPLTVEVFQRGYRRATQTVTLKPKEVRTFNVGTLAAESGGIELRLTNAGLRLEQAKILIDGKPVAVGRGIPAEPSAVGRVIPNAPSASAEERWIRDNPPYLIDSLEVGPRSLEIAHPDYEPWRQTATVRDGETTAVAVALIPKPAVLTLAVSGATDYTLVVNGQETPVNGSEASLPVRAELAVEIRSRGFKTASQRLTLPANGRQTWTVVLEKIAGLEVGQPWAVPDLGLELVWIKPGAFMMGTPAGAGGFPDESPPTRVELTQGYWLGKYEVTQSEYQAVMGANPSKFQGARRPVERVSWRDAVEFCRKLTERERAAHRLLEGYVYTLPTEAQWEYACRAGTTGTYAGELNALAWFTDNCNGTTHEVGTKQPNPWGLYDMHGNVRELCFNQQAGAGGNNRGSVEAENRVARGGSWSDIATFLRSANRNWHRAGTGWDFLGFRVALASQVAAETPPPVARYP